MSDREFTIQAEIEAIGYIIQVRKYSEDLFDVGYLYEDDEFVVKHINCNAVSVINALSFYLNAAFYNLKSKN